MDFGTVVYTENDPLHVDLDEAPTVGVEVTEVTVLGRTVAVASLPAVLATIAEASILERPIKPVEDEDKVYEKTSVQFTATDPETKTLQLSPAGGKTWHLDQIRAWTDEAPSDNSNDGSKTDIDIYINGTVKQIAKSYSTEQIGTTYRTCGIAINCRQLFGQRLEITETTNGVYVTATKTGAGTHTLYLQVEGTEI